MSLLDSELIKEKGFLIQMLQTSNQLKKSYPRKVNNL